MELKQRENDSLQLQHYANVLLQRFAQVQPNLVRRAMKLLDSFNNSSFYGDSVSLILRSDEPAANTPSKTRTLPTEKRLIQQPNKGQTSSNLFYHKRYKPHINAIPRRALSVPAVDKSATDGIEC